MPSAVNVVAAITAPARAEISRSRNFLDEEKDKPIFSYYQRRLSVSVAFHNVDLRGRPETIQATFPQGQEGVAQECRYYRCTGGFARSEGGRDHRVCLHLLLFLDLAAYLRIETLTMFSL